MLQLHRSDNLPSDLNENSVRIKIRRNFVLENTLEKLENGLDVNKRLRVIFLDETAVDAGGPMREYLHLLMAAVARNNTLFCGKEDSRVPLHNLRELEKRTFYHIGKIISLSLLYGGPGATFFSPAVADYITYGISRVKATIDDVPTEEVRQKLLKVSSNITVTLVV